MFLLLCAPALRAADIDVRTDRSPVGLSESFQILYEAAGGVDGEPDFSPLERDFQIISTSQSSRLTIVNGRTSSTKTWTLTVLARRTGRLEIPPIAFGRDRSPAATVEVTMGAGAPAVPGGSGASSEVFLEVEAKPLSPYVQQQIVYIVRLYRAFPTANASLSEPEVEQGEAIIERVGEDSVYDRRVNGRPYQVVERRYAIYPQASGALKIAPLTFQGRTGGAFSLLDPFGRGPESIVRQSAPVELSVRARPDAAQGATWLPAQALTLSESWLADPPEFRAGMPVTRTLTLTAKGLTASQLPELPRLSPASFKIYPDQPELADAHDGDGITGTRVEKVAIIPSQPGDYELPAIRIPWWNTETDRAELAELPARRIRVLPSTGTAAAPAAESAPASAVAAPAAADTVSAAPASPGPWRHVSLALAVLWLATLLGWWWTSRPRRVAKGPGAPLPGRKAAVRRALEQACARGDGAAAKEALLAWGALHWPDAPPRSLGDMAARSGTPLAEALRALDAALYGPARGAWDGRALWRAFRESESPRGDGDDEPGSALEPLHRIG
jgi:hypothetical protein